MIATTACAEVDEPLLDVDEQGDADQPVVGTSSAEVVSPRCATCVAICCRSCDEWTRYDCAASCWHLGQCSQREYYSFRPSFQEP